MSTHTERTVPDADIGAAAGEQTAPDHAARSVRDVPRGKDYVRDWSKEIINERKS